jgi:hypothetical protein
LLNVDSFRRSPGSLRGAAKARHEEPQAESETTGLVPSASSRTTLEPPRAGAVEMTAFAGGGAAPESAAFWSPVAFQLPEPLSQ